jgi:hypothetical protein
MAVPSVTSDNFLAVALVVNRSRDGPAFVFHYPAQVEPHSKSGSVTGNELEDILLERLSQQSFSDVADDAAVSKQGRKMSTRSLSQALRLYHGSVSQGFPPVILLVSSRLLVRITNGSSNYP